MTHIRKQVGQAREETSPAQQVFRLRQMVWEALTEEERTRALWSDDEHIRKVVGRFEPGPH